jgi:hypothetical protein
MDWEAWLRTSSSPPSDSEDIRRDRTEKQIKEALRAHAPLNGRPYEVYTKGSYANNTNVRLNFDVDIAVEYRGYFYLDMAFDLRGQPKEVVGLVESEDPYTRDEFRADVRAALVNAFGASSVSAGNIAYRIRESKTTIPADVVPCWELRRYDKITQGVPLFHKGSRLFPSSGGYTDNFPAQQNLNGTEKNKRTSMRYKYMVRALKRLQTKLVADGNLANELPSYLIECLVYNVPDPALGSSSYLSDMRAVLAYIFNATLPNGDSNDWAEVNDLKWLFRGTQPWTVADVHNLADVAWEAMDLG